MIEYEQDEESEEEPEPMETDQTPIATTIVEQVETAKADGSANEASSNETTALETAAVKDNVDGQEKISTTTTTTTEQPKETSNTTADITATAKTTTSTPNKTPDNAPKKLDETSIPGGPSSIISNKAVSSIMEEEDDDERSQTPKLDDISDDEKTNAEDDEEDNDVDSINDASKHPALAPHAQAHMTDDDMTDSTVATPQTTTEGNTPMPLLEDEPMEESSNALPHPLSQEILTGATAFMNNEDTGSLNNDSPAIQTPEDHVIQHEPEAMEEQ